MDSLVGTRLEQLSTVKRLATAGTSPLNSASEAERPMHRHLSWIGLTVFCVVAIAPGAIADDQTPLKTSMSDLDLPDLETPVQSAPMTDVPKMAELTSTFPNPDVSPTHWAYAAVNNLTQDYRCISGYPDGTFRGEQPLTRYEFAAALNACLETVLQQVDAERPVNLNELLEELDSLQEELGTLSGEVEAIETREGL